MEISDYGKETLNTPVSMDTHLLYISMFYRHTAIFKSMISNMYTRSFITHRRAFSVCFLKKILRTSQSWFKAWTWSIIMLMNHVLDFINYSIRHESISPQSCSLWKAIIWECSTYCLYERPQINAHVIRYCWLC